MNIDFNNDVFLQRQSMYLNFDKSTDKTLVDQSQIQYEYKMTGYFISANSSNGQPQYNENKIDYESNWIKITDKEIIQDKIKAKITTPSLDYDSVISVQIRAIDENNGQYSNISEPKQCILIKNDRSNVIIDNINWNNKNIEIQLNYDIKSALPSNAAQLSSNILLLYRKKILENINFKIDYTYTTNNITPSSFLYNTSFILTTSSAISPISLLTINNLNNNQNYYIWVQLTNNITGEKDLVYRLFLSKAPAFLIYKNGAGANLPQTNEFFPAKLLSNKSEISQQSFAIFDSSYDRDILNEKPSIGFYSLPQAENFMGELICQKIDNESSLVFKNNNRNIKNIFITDKENQEVEELLQKIPEDYDSFVQTTNNKIEEIDKSISEIKQTNETQNSNINTNKTNLQKLDNKVSDLEKELNNIILTKIYPVGSIKITTNATNPSTYLGGTWISWGSGRIPIGVDNNSDIFKTSEITGGSSSHSHTAGTLMACIDTKNANNFFTYKTVEDSNNRYVITGYSSTLSNHTLGGGSTTRGTDVVGNTGSEENYPPYITCYMWKRTA